MAVKELHDMDNSLDIEFRPLDIEYVINLHFVHCIYSQCYQ
jgi:hypothetical protein